MRFRLPVLILFLGSLWAGHALAEPTVNVTPTGSVTPADLSPGGSGIGELTPKVPATPASGVTPLRSGLQAEAMGAGLVELQSRTPPERHSDPAVTSGSVLRFLREHALTVLAVVLAVLLTGWLAVSGVWWLRMNYEMRRAARRRRRRTKAGDSGEPAASENVKRRETRRHRSERRSGSSRRHGQEGRSADPADDRDADSTDSGVRSVRPRREPPPDASSA